MKSLITGGLLVASLALTGNAAMAANMPAHKIRPAARHIVTPQPLGEPNADIGQFIQSIFGGGPQYQALMQNAGRSRSSRRSTGSYDGSPSYDSSPTIDSSATDAQAASDAEAQAIQSMNDTNALNASTAAAEAANDAANAATVQTEINANN
jgi:hypothetical protein